MAVSDFYIHGRISPYRLAQQVAFSAWVRNAPRPRRLEEAVPKRNARVEVYHCRLPREATEEASQ